jgi:hypothetical protein
VYNWNLKIEQPNLYRNSKRNAIAGVGQSGQFLITQISSLQNFEVSGLFSS